MIQKLDYRNSHFYGSPMYLQERLQKVQHSASGQIFQCRKQNHISALLISLHWLPINVRIEYKLSVISHSFFLVLSPIYLSYLLSVYTPKGNLHSSSDNRILCIHRPRTKTFGHRSFSLAVLQYGILWLHNSEKTDSIQKFKSAFKNSSS